MALLNIINASLVQTGACPSRRTGKRFGSRRASINRLLLSVRVMRMKNEKAEDAELERYINSVEDDAAADVQKLLELEATEFPRASWLIWSVAWCMEGILMTTSNALGQTRNGNSKITQAGSYHEDFDPDEPIDPELEAVGSRIRTRNGEGTADRGRAVARRRGLPRVRL
jgi:hypothetical protein